VQNHPVSRPYSRYVHEFLFALNTACAIVFFAFANSAEADAPFAHLEVRINHLLHIRQTDFIRGHFQFWIPALGLALFFLLLLRRFWRAELTNDLLRWVAGGAAFFLLPAVWICSDPHRGRLFMPPYEGPFELAVVITVFVLVLYRNWSVPVWASLTGAAMHYAFWYWLFNGLHVPNWSAPGYLGPAGPILAFCASVAWATYRRSILPAGDSWRLPT
jgi:hypothetical protein